MITEYIIVRNLNVELNVPKEDAEKYRKLGYSIVDKDGNVIEEAVTNDVAALNQRISKLKAENEELKNEISKLKARKKTTADK